MPHPKRELSGKSLEAFTPGIEFGRRPSVDVFERLYEAASKVDPSEPLLTGLTHGDLLRAIDDLVPLFDGERDLSAGLDFPSMGTQIEDQLSPTSVIAMVQSKVWMQPMDMTFLDESPLDVWHAIQHMEYVSTYLPVNTPEPVEDDSPSM
jgi:hypothetical protein